MSVTSTIPIQIGNTVVQFPNSGASPNWAPAVIEFAELVALALQSSASPFDVSPAVMAIPSDGVTAQQLTGSGSNLSFPAGQVASYTFTYSIYLVSDSASKIQTGTVIGVYNTDSGEWFIQHEFAGDVQTDGKPYLTFTMNGSDELLYTTVAIGGVFDSVNSKISYYAKTNLVSA